MNGISGVIISAPKNPESFSMFFIKYFLNVVFRPRLGYRVSKRFDFRNFSPEALLQFPGWGTL